jgi:hypothetical protein
MSKFFQQAGAVALVVLAINGFWGFAAADVEPQKPQRLWEYVGMTSANAEREKLADKGWELVDVESAVLWFKRPK